ncbi:uncharacterized protein LOC109853040 [Pseudomyrmex gracilis]|uniref:uncharacterized protein LOC109853040 n=1 Tax=Pseudomyrmex gracilis TaxID=219809 RepID=UPI000994AE92|nr:uncharacterized protein LOC109853040 [Pseudomyrmex gracilis]XP_020280336.1 uncharacterized protein LOC109853040 [Pseudomyrmex gracilis]
MLFYLILVTALPAVIVGLPQNTMTRVDGFFFDGPAATTLSNSTTVSTITTTVTASSTIVSSAPYDVCVASCPVTNEYNPVCGTDNADYTNPGGLGCAQRCGKDVTLNYYGRCSTGRTG